MSESEPKNFRDLAATMREKLRAANESQQEDAAVEKNSLSDDEDINETTPHPAETEKPSTVRVEKEYFNEAKIRVTSSRIEIGKFTYRLKFLAAIQRIDKDPPKRECVAALSVSALALLALIIYIFVGRLQFGFMAVILLSVGLLAFAIAGFVCQQMKGRYTLKFKNAQGDEMKSVTKHNKQLISRLEKAVKTAIAENEHRL